MARRQALRPDPLNPEQRRKNMAAVRAADTKPEMLVRRGLHRLGLRYRLHDRALPGTPDLVFRSVRTVVFVHGCFWHGHDCPLGVRPRANGAFWDAKINRNIERDRQAIEALGRLGWRTAAVWECALRGPGRLEPETMLATLNHFIGDRSSVAPTFLDIRCTDA